MNERKGDENLECNEKVDPAVRHPLMQPQCDSAGAAPSAHWHRQSVDKGLAVHLSAGESVPEHYDKQNDSRRQRASEHCGRGERRARIGRRIHSAPMAATLHRICAGMLFLSAWHEFLLLGPIHGRCWKKNLVSLNESVFVGVTISF